MALYNKFNDFVNRLGQGAHALGTHVYRCMLSNTAVSATQAVRADITEITAGNGYTAGGADATVTWSTSAGTGTAVGTQVTWTASGGTIGPLRYVVLYNDTQTSPADPLVCWWDYGSSITLNVGETFTVRFNSSPTTGAIFSLS